MNRVKEKQQLWSQIFVSHLLYVNGELVIAKSIYKANILL